MYMLLLSPSFLWQEHASFTIKCKLHILFWFSHLFSYHYAKYAFLSFLQLDREDELERITSNGGRILNWGCPRVEGVLSMSRAIGFSWFCTTQLFIYLFPWHEPNNCYTTLIHVRFFQPKQKGCSVCVFWIHFLRLSFLSKNKNWRDRWTYLQVYARSSIAKSFVAITLRVPLQLRKFIREI